MSFCRVAKRSTGTSLYLHKIVKFYQKNIKRKKSFFFLRGYSNLVLESFYWSVDGFKKNRNKEIELGWVPLSFYC